MTDVHFIETWREGWKQACAYMPAGFIYESNRAVHQGRRLVVLRTGFAVVSRAYRERSYANRSELPGHKTTIEVPVEHKVAHIIVDDRLSAAWSDSRR